MEKQPKTFFFLANPCPYHWRLLRVSRSYGNKGSPTGWLRKTRIILSDLEARSLKSRCPGGHGSREESFLLLTSSYLIISTKPLVSNKVTF